MFARCLKWHARHLGILLRSVWPRLYAEEQAFLAQAAQARSMTEVRGLVEGWRYEVGVRQRGRSWWFDIVPRPSGRRMLNESKALFQAAGADARKSRDSGEAAAATNIQGAQSDKATRAT